MQIFAIISLVLAFITSTIASVRSGFDIWYWISLAAFIPALVSNVMLVIREKKKNDSSKHLKNSDKDMSARKESEMTS